MIEKIVGEFVENACRQPSNVFTYSFFKEHILDVLNYADMLCDKLNGNKEVTRISAYLHDISAVIDISALPEHNHKSSEFARKFLFDNGVPEIKVAQICKCITSHPLPVKIGEGAIEEVCLSNADAMSQISNLSYWCFFIFKIRNLNYEDGMKWLRTKIKTNWDNIVDPAKEILRSEYSTVCKLLKI